jgi:hypothetical protein
MNAGAFRAAGAIFLLGVLVVWLIRPIGNACPDVDKLPAGSTGSSAPSLTPPLTRTCTYSTPDGTKARQRYVPVVDVLVLAVIAGVVGGAIGLFGAGRRGKRQTLRAGQRRAVRERPERSGRGS